jgi:intracellular sulfur oxidation DsrE/DsrF family protein
MKNDMWPRRSLMSGLGASVAAFVFGSKSAAAQTPPGGFQPARHPQDEWFDKLPGKHRIFIDVISATGTGEAVAFANNLYTANKQAYGIDEADLAMVMCLRHSATVFAFTDAIWSKHGKALADSAKYTNPRATEPPSANPYLEAPRNAFGTLAKRGLQFAVCDTASHRISRLLAGTDGDAEAMYKTMVANAIPNSRFVSAGVVALTRSQEYGYSLLYAG